MGSAVLSRKRSSIQLVIDRSGSSPPQQRTDARGLATMLLLHIASGVMAWVVRAIALWLSITGRRSRDGLAAFHWSVLAVAVTASIMVASRPAQPWWLWLLAACPMGSPC
jgi:hypothetical protein